LGALGAWTFELDGRPAAEIAAAAVAIDALGLSSLWVPEGGGSTDVLAHVSWLLASTRTLTVASGIANITVRQPDALARGAALIDDAYGGRFVLGIGVGHEYSTDRRGQRWDLPLARTRAYLDGMDAAAGERPAPPRMLAALGDAMLQLSAERALGAHTYFVPPEHTAHAREVLGPEPVLAVEQTAVLRSDPSEARSIARGWAADYLELPNYARSWKRLGFAGDVAEVTDRLVDAAVAWGSVEDVAGRVRAHLAAGADHVCVQVIGEDGPAGQRRALERLAPAVLET